MSSILNRALNSLVPASETAMKLAWFVVMNLLAQELGTPDCDRKQLVGENRGRLEADRKQLLRELLDAHHGDMAAVENQLQELVSGVVILK